MIERDELTGRFLSRPLIERFHEGYEVDQDSGCWVWIKSRRPRGPGALKRGAGVNADAHRVAYELMIGPIPPGTFVCHRCDNPPCVNPDHLFLGTGADNVRDRDEKGRQAKGQGHGRAKLSEHDVLDVLASDASNKALGERFGVSRTAIYLIRAGLNWKAYTVAARTYRRLTVSRTSE